ncbi:MAG: putative 4-hydroxybenzoate polyprenyltransferase [Verrucomicrobiae bacterium]|nr:putative 4-hydroxybenzoate polyprenyltransferase [Verrucomicrobiae bacterium]
MRSIRDYLEFVRFSHTVFALPFALASMTLAARGWPGWRLFGLIVVAMVTARTAAMGFNRIVDRRFDALNPRTAARHLPSGRMTLCEAWTLVVVAAALFVVTCHLINWICFALSPVALAIVFFYSLTKRFTDFSHFFLGLALAVAPVGAWLAVRGSFSWTPLVLALAVVFWLVGLDIVYATQDYESDRLLGLRSLPVRWGIARSLRFARWAHAAMGVTLAGLGPVAGLGWKYYAGVGVIAACLAAEHVLAQKQDPVSLNRAFFRMNAIVSVVFLAAVVADVALRG